MIKEEHDDYLPATAIELVEMLSEHYPDKIVTRELSPYEQGKLHGVIDVIRILRLRYSLDEELEDD